MLSTFFPSPGCGSDLFNVSSSPYRAANCSRMELFRDHFEYRYQPAQPIRPTAIRHPITKYKLRLIQAILEFKWVFDLERHAEGEGLSGGFVHYEVAGGF